MNMVEYDKVKTITYLEYCDYLPKNMWLVKLIILQNHGIRTLKFLERKRTY